MCHRHHETKISHLFIILLIYNKNNKKIALIFLYFEKALYLCQWNKVVTITIK